MIIDNYYTNFAKGLFFARILLRQKDLKGAVNSNFLNLAINREKFWL